MTPTIAVGAIVFRGPDLVLLVAADDAAELRWVPVSDLGELGVSAEVRRVIDQVLELQDL